MFYCWLINQFSSTLRCFYKVRPCHLVDTLTHLKCVTSWSRMVLTPGVREWGDETWLYHMYIYIYKLSKSLIDEFNSRGKTQLRFIDEFNAWTKVAETNYLGKYARVRFIRRGLAKFLKCSDIEGTVGGKVVVRWKSSKRISEATKRLRW